MAIICKHDAVDALNITPYLPASCVHYTTAYTYPTPRQTYALVCYNVGWRFPWQPVSLENSQIQSKAVEKSKLKGYELWGF